MVDGSWGPGYLRWVTRGSSAVALAVLVAGWCVEAGAQETKPAAPAAPRKSSEARTADRDRKAKTLFAAGRYQEAVDVLAPLYAETGNATYLRNIGRCYQRLRDPDKAIASFEEYLEERPRDHNGALAAARLDAGEEAERLVGEAYGRVLEALLAATRRAA